MPREVGICFDSRGRVVILAVWMKRILVYAFAACFIFAGFLVAAHIRARDATFRNIAKSYLNQAEAQASASTTAEDAKRWLEGNGFIVKQISGNWVGEHSSPGMPTVNEVSGYKLLAPTSAFHFERWMEMDFSFHTTSERWKPGTFAGVTVYDVRAPPKWLKNSALSGDSLSSSKSATAPSAR